jgi:hypothetical protein
MGRLTTLRSGRSHDREDRSQSLQILVAEINLDRSAVKDVQGDLISERADRADAFTGKRTRVV